jgi:hypothetical protein
MDSLFEEVISKLNHLSSIRERFVIRAELLPADLAVDGQYNDIREAAFLAVQLCRLHSHSAAFPLARTVFEGAQRLIILTTEEDYLSLGTRAWLYDLRKQKRIVYLAQGHDAANGWFQRSVDQIQRIWENYNSGAARILHDENARLDEFQKDRGRADNFVGRDIGKVVEERYPKLATTLGESSTGLGKLNSGIYAALSRESHARLRAYASGLRITPDGTVEIVPESVDETSKIKLVLGCISPSLSEASAGLSYLVESRERRRSAELAEEASRLATKPLAPGFKRDLGLHLMKIGCASTTFHFSDVPVHKIGILPDGLVRWSSDITLGEQEVYIATFDVPPALVPELQRALEVDRSVLTPGSEVKKHRLGQPRTIRLDCTLGEIQNSLGDAFVPLSVTRIGLQEVEPGKRPN